jgi:hypothetical protein
MDKRNQDEIEKSENKKSEVREASALKEPNHKFGMAELQKI